MVLTLVAALYLGGGWGLATYLGQAGLYAHPGGAPSPNVFPVPVLRLADSPGVDQITLGLVPGHSLLTAPGVWGVRSPAGGFGQILKIEASDSRGVTRQYRQLSGPQITTGERVQLVAAAYPDNPAALGLKFSNVTYPGPLGSYPAWLIPGSGPDWAILVHGKGLTRQDEMQMIPPLHAAGLNLLVITYRNDIGAPPAPDGMFGYGRTEWQDLQAAVSYALAHGARHLILAGRSAGGGVIMSFLYRSSLAPRVQAVVLDSPMLDFRRTVDFEGSELGIPLVRLPIYTSIRNFAEWMATWRFGLDWSTLDYLAHDRELKTPILLFQGTADTVVPPATSAQLAQDRPDLVTYVVTPGAGHIESWNLNPQRYDGILEAFARRYA